MFTQRNSKKIKNDFQKGDLVKFVYVEKSNYPQVWNRVKGLGVILSMRKEPEDLMMIYTVLSNGESFECVEVYPIEETEAVCTNENKYSQ